MDISTNSTHSKAVGWSLVDSLVPVDNWQSSTGVLDLAIIVSDPTALSHLSYPVCAATIRKNREAVVKSALGNLASQGRDSLNRVWRLG